MTIQEAAMQALQVQNASNLSGVTRSLSGEILDAVWAEANNRGEGTRWVAQHPVVTMFLLKMCELNGCCAGSLLPAYEPAEKACKELAGVHKFEADSIVDDCKVCGNRFAVHYEG